LGPFRLFKLCMDILSVFQGISTPLPELVSHINQLGWQLGRVQFDKGRGEYVAEVTGPQGQVVAKSGPDETTAVANCLLAATRRNYIRSAALYKSGMWQADFHSKLHDIAEAYAKAPLYDPKAVAAYKTLADDSMHRADIIGSQIQIEDTPDPHPYTNVEALMKDVRKNRKYKVSTAHTRHPVWTPEQVRAYRICHDVLGHAVTGSGFDWHGETQAAMAHLPLVDNHAQHALFSEAVGYPAYQQIYGIGPQKAALFPEFISEHQEGPAYRGLHPVKTVVPSVVPAFKHAASGQELDVNHGWTSGFDPLPEAAYLRGDPLQSKAVMDNAALIDTGWSKFTRPDGQPDRERMKQAIVNAFRVVLLSPRKDLKWNAVHYQDIADVPANESDPLVYWRTLEKKRQEWNVARFGEQARFSHAPYKKLLQPLYSVLYQADPHAGMEAALEKGERLIMQWHTEEVDRLMSEDAGKPADQQMPADDVERKANQLLSKRIKQFIDEYIPKMDFEKASSVSWADLESRTAQQESLFDVEPEQQVAAPRVERYGAFMGTHLKAISKISQFADRILDAALEDVQMHDAAGHHFRKAVLDLAIPGVGPKVCSFSWLLLQPLTSQLATIDTHMMDVLGHHYEKDMNNRDYFKFERQLQAGRDASGYGHVPLGTFQWGMWDYKRTGPGSHQDHSAMAVLDPKPHDQIDWASKALNLKGNEWLKQGPEWWQATQPHRDAVGSEWDQTFAKQVPSNSYPVQVVSPAQTISKVAYGESFKDWWEKETPIGYDLDPKARKLAEYAAATKKTKHELEEFLDDHKKDARLSELDWRRFKKKLFAKFDRINKHGALDGRIPWFKHQDHHFEGLPGQTLMHHMRTTLGLSPQELWELFPDDAPVGKN
jgi:hypothetical protein